jgi:hypothetical protein
MVLLQWTPPEHSHVQYSFLFLQAHGMQSVVDYNNGKVAQVRYSDAGHVTAAQQPGLCSGSMQAVAARKAQC